MGEKKLPISVAFQFSNLINSLGEQDHEGPQPSALTTPHRLPGTIHAQLVQDKIVEDSLLQYVLMMIKTKPLIMFHVNECLARKAWF